MVHKKYYKIWDGDLARLADSGKKKKKREVAKYYYKHKSI